SNFDLANGDKANLILPSNTDNLVNMVTGNNKSFIDGTLNAYKNGKIGGNVFFLNPNGIIIGATGIVNVGALTLATPTRQYIDDILNNPAGFNAGNFSNAVLSGDVPINPNGNISIKGKINAYYGVAAHSNDVEIKGGTAKINTLSAVNPADIVNLSGIPSRVEMVENADGRILITGKDIEIDDGATIKSIKDSANGFNRAGDIDILAENKGKSLADSRTASINIGRADIEGGHVNIEAIAENKYEYKDLPPIMTVNDIFNVVKSVVSDIVENPENAEEYIQDIKGLDTSDLFVLINAGLQLLDDYGVEARFAYSDINASVSIGDNAKIKASNDINIKSIVESDTKVETEGSDIVSAAMAINNSSSLIKLGLAALESGNDINISAKSVIESNLKAGIIGDEDSSFATALALSVVTNNTEIISRADIKADNDISISNNVEKNNKLSIKTNSENDETISVDIAAALSFLDNHLNIAGNIESGNDFNVQSNFAESNSGIKVTDAGIGIGINNNELTSDINMSNSNIRANGDININANTRLKDNSSIKGTPLSTDNVLWSAIVAFSKFNFNTSINLLNNVQMGSQKNINVSAITQKDISVSADATTENAENIGIVAAYSGSDIENKIVVGGAQINSKNINMDSTINSVNNRMEVEVISGQGVNGRQHSLNDNENLLLNTSNNILIKQLSKTTGGQDQDETNFSIGIAMGYAEHTNNSEINLDVARLNAEKDININAKVIDANITNDIVAVLRQKPQYSFSGAVLYALYSDYADAFIGNSDIYARENISILSEQRLPTICAIRNPFLTELEVSNDIEERNIEHDIYEYTKNGILNVNDGYFNNWVRSSMIDDNRNINSDATILGAADLTHFDLRAQSQINNSKINQDGVKTGKQNVKVEANSDNSFISVGGIVGGNTSQENSLLGIGVSYNQIDYVNNTKSFIYGINSEIYADNLSVVAKSNQNDITVGLAGLDSRNLDIKGAVNRVGINSNVDAYVDDIKKLEVAVDGLLSINAQSNGYIINIAGNAFALQSSGIGTSVALSNIDRKTNAYMKGLKDVKVGKTNIFALNDGLMHTYSVAGSIGNDTSDIGNPFSIGRYLNDFFYDLFSFELYIKTKNLTKIYEKFDDIGEDFDIKQHLIGFLFDLKNSELGISGSVSVNEIFDNSNAYIEDSDINVESDLLIKADNKAAIISASGDISLSLMGGDGRDITGAASINNVNNTANTYITASDIYGKGIIDLNAVNRSPIISVAVGLDGLISDIFGFNVTGSITSNETDNETKAYIKSSHIVSEKDVFLNAKDDSDIFSLAGVAVFGSVVVGAGASVSANVLTNKVSAYLNNTDINIGSNKISISAYNSPKIQNFATNISNVGRLNIEGSAILNDINNNANAYIENSDEYRVYQIDSGDIDIKSLDDTHMQGSDGTVDIADWLSIGASIVNNNMHNNVNAYISGRNGQRIIINSLGSINVNAISDTKTDFNIISVGFGFESQEYVSISGAAEKNDIANIAHSYIEEANIFASGNVNLFAENKDKMDLFIGSLAISSIFSVGASAWQNTIHNEAIAEIKNNSKINSLQSIFVKSNLNEEINNYAFSAAIGGYVTIAGMAMLTDIGNKSSASIKKAMMF
ncbi:MAG: leukotoxin LktA family filamentous adhesin, partial [Elusimicrobiota bacterium]|nr:leukotoxin LktA family filamentous adhesin [Elusimicrobiota bacterium]